MNTDVENRVARYIEQGKSHREIQDIEGIGLATISRIRNKGIGENRVLVIGDIHEPCARDGYLEFCKDIERKHKTNKTVFVGDIVDWHGISFHARTAEAPGVLDEYYLAHGCIQDWYKAFPKATVTIGNHDDRIRRVAESVNIPSKFIRNDNEIWGTPNWDWVDNVIIDDVYYMHGIGHSGTHPAYNAARQMCMSVCMGHVHSTAGIKWMASPQKRWFGMDVGCGVDDKKYAFAYGKNNKKKSVLGCGVVIDGNPYYEIMWLEKYK